MPTKRTPKEPTPAPTPSELLPDRLAALRRRRGWTQQELGDRLAALGVGLDRGAVAKMETRHRNVSIDEAVWLAVALDVPPSALLLPQDETPVRLTSTVTIPARQAHRWFRGTYIAGEGLPSDAVVANHEDPNLDAWRMWSESVSNADFVAHRTLPKLWNVESTLAALVDAAANPADVEALEVAAEKLVEEAERLLDEVQRRTKEQARGKR